MASIQERLQLKRVPLDTWSVREQLCLASAVVRSGDQNWMSVSRALKTVGEPNRPPDWYSQKSCAAQYGALLEHVETPKRKKRCSEGAVETPQESIVKRLTQDRIAEIQKNIADMNQQYETLKNEISEVRNQATPEERLREIWASIEASKRASERETARRAALLKEREEMRARAARNSRGSITNEPPSPSATPATPSSPLLTSLLKSSPVVTTPQHLSHPASVVDTMSPSVNAPTLSMLLEKSSPQQDSKRAAIEHIKSQLVQIEQQLKANTPPSPAPLAPPAPAAPPALDIDDIEINAEDVYVFRDVDIHIPSVAPSHSQDKPVEKPISPKKEVKAIEIVDTMEIEMDPIASAPEEAVNVTKEVPVIVEEIKAEVPIYVENIATEEATVQETPEETVATETEDVKIAFPEVKFPTTEIKVIQPDEQKIKEETKDLETSQEQIQDDTENVHEEVVVHEDEASVDSVEEQISNLHAEPAIAPPQLPQQLPPQLPPDLPPQLPPQLPPELPPQSPPLVSPPLPEEPTLDQVIETQNIPLPPEPEVKEPPLPVEPEPVVAVPPQPEVKEERPDVTEEIQANVEPPPEKSEEDIKRDEDAEDSIPLKQMIREETLRTIREERITEDTHTETDDDTPMELSREEEKDGKKKRDYSRKKKPDSRTCSGSESAAEVSAPDSPGGDSEMDHRLWKKSVMLVFSRLCAHKYASLFLRPITDEEAPGYSAVVRRPMDLSTIRRNIESGRMRTTAQFQRDLLLMLSNALMYNSSEHSVYTMAKEMHEEAVCELGILVSAQAHASLNAPSPRRKRRRPDDRLRDYKRPH